MAAIFTPDFGWEVFVFALRLYVGWVAWAGARNIAADPELARFKKLPRHSPLERLLAYGQVVVACLALTALLWVGYGTHRESEDSDPIRGGGVTITDFEPTPAERTRHALPFFLVLLPIALHGTWYGRRRTRVGGS